MPYTIKARVIQKDPAKWFSIVEETVWHSDQGGGGTWTDGDGEQTLSMGDRSSSGTLRFKNLEGEYFLVALGVHKSKRWCDVVPDLKAFQTGLWVHPEYYGKGRTSVPPKQNSEVVKQTTSGATISVEYYKEDGDNLYATITINP